MISQHHSAKIDQGLTPLRIIWFAMLCSVGIYVFMSFMLPIGEIKITLPDELVGTMRLAAYVLAPVLFLAARSTKKYIMNKAKVPSSMRPNPDGSMPHPAVAIYTNATVIPLAIVDLIAVAGLVLYLIGKNQQDCLVLSAIAAAMKISFMPKRDEVEELAQRMQRDGKLTA